MEKLKKSFIWGFLSFILILAITMQIKLTNTNESNYSQARVADKLKDQIFKLNEEKNKKTENLEKYEDELEKIRDDAAKNDSSNVNYSELIKKYSAFLGQTNIEGQGIILKYEPFEDEYLADIARDLRDLVNEFKNAGAQAISINNERLINSSSIEMVKNKIEINEKQLKEPYIIKVIGNSDVIYSSMTRPMGEIEVIENTGVKISIEKKEKVKIEKYK